MARRVRRRTVPAARQSAPTDPDDQEGLARLLARITDIEADDPDEPGRWAAFFARLRAAVGGGAEEG